MSSLPPANRTIPVNLQPPGPLSLEESARQFRGARFLRPHRAGLFGLAAVAAFGLAGGWPAAASAAVGVGAALAAGPLAYAPWLALFSARCYLRNVCCPCCLSRMSQLCCARCGEPVPALALMLGGCFLPDCPHCGLGLSSRFGTLLAWCSTCLYRIERPREFYRRRAHLAVLAGVPPLCVPGGLAEVAGAVYGPAGFVDGEPNATFVLLVADGTAVPAFDNHVIARTSLLLLSSHLDEQHKARFRSFFPRAVEREVE